MAREESGLSRRTFLKASCLTAGAGLVGVGATGAAAAHAGFHREFGNPRTWELSRVWEKGYRGRPSRSVAVGDTGCDARHPDLSWNNVRIVEGDDELALEQVTNVDTDGEPVGDVGPYSGTLGPGIADAGVTERQTHDLDVPADANRIEATATWTPQRQDNELLLLDEKGNEVASSTDFNPFTGKGEHVTGPVEPGYALAVETYANVSASYEIMGTFVQNDTTIEDLPDGYDPLPEGPVDVDTPTLVGWKGGTLARDGNGHGSHTTSTSAGSGQGSAIDEANLVEERPFATLLPGDVLEYEVEPEAGHADSADNGGVFASVYGNNVEIAVENPDGETVEEAIVRANTIENDASLHGDSTVADAYAATPGTYTVYVKPSETEFDAPSTVGRVDRVAIGPLLPPSETTGDRTDGSPTLHAGAAPNASLVAFQGLDNALTALSTYPGFFTGTYGLRTANFSFGGLQTERLGLSDTYLFVKDIAEGGILTVSSAGNFGPLTGSTGPSGADEAIAVAATGPMDGLTSYTSGGTVVRGQDDGNEGSTPAGEVYRKPDVTAPGGLLTDTVNAVQAGDPDSDDPVRDYVGYAGTSMAAPYTNGVAGLVAEAMEFGPDGRPAGVTLPEPTATTYADVLRLKGVLLATATETAFTAAPYHRAHTPTYDFGDRDPYEGFGRVNPDAAVDAVTRSFAAVTEAVVGLDRHADSRAVAGYLAPGEDGTFSISVDFSHYSGGNKGMTEGAPHVDLYVYDAANPGPNGDPTVVSRVQGREGGPEVSFTADAGGAYVAVAKLVNVPGAVNGYDVQAHLELSTSFDAALPVDAATRQDDASVFTGGQTNHVIVEVEASDDVYVRDVVPSGWSVLDGDYDHTHELDDGTILVVFTSHVGGGSTSVAGEYFAEAPEGLETTDSYTFGPVEVSTDGETWVQLSGTSDTNLVVGQST